MALTDMRLRVFSSLLVASLLGGCASSGSDVVETPVDVLPEPVATPSVSDHRWVELADVLRRHLPLPEGQRGIYLLTTRDQPFVAVHGDPIAATCKEDWCVASMTRAQSSGQRVFRLDPSLGLLPIAKEQIGALRAKLLAASAADDPDVHALKMLEQPPDNGGFWRVESAGSKLNADPNFAQPYAVPSFIKSDPNVDYTQPLPEMVSFAGAWLTASGEIEPLPDLGGASPSRALLRPLADGARLLTVTIAPQGCGSQSGNIHYVIPKGSRAAIKVHQQLGMGMDCQHHRRGRPPEGLVSLPAPLDDGVAEFFSIAAHLEAASIVAFERLAGELTGLGAPSELIAAASVAAEDERRHAEAMLALGARHGVTATPVEVTSLASRSMLAIAIENAVEGCVNEAFAAVLCDYQAAAAEDEALADAMRVIAEEEHAHAALAARTAAWLDTRLNDAERAEVRAAVEHALISLPELAVADAARNKSSAATLGMPSPAHAALLAQRFVAFMRKAA